MYYLRHITYEVTDMENQEMVANVGDLKYFKHRLEPHSPIIVTAGTVLSTGITKDGVHYIESNVGSHTKKYVVEMYR